MTGCSAGRFEGMSSVSTGRDPDTIGASMLRIWRLLGNPSGRRFSGFAEKLVFIGAPRLVRQVQNSQAVLRELQQAVRITANVIAAVAPPPPTHHRGPAGDQRQLSHLAAGPKAGVRPKPRWPRRSRRDRLDVGGLRGRSHSRQGPAGPGRGTGPRRTARVDGVQPGAPCRRSRLDWNRFRSLGLRGQAELGPAGPGARNARRGHSPRRRDSGRETSMWWPPGCGPSTPGANHSV